MKIDSTERWLSGTAGEEKKEEGREQTTSTRFRRMFVLHRWNAVCIRSTRSRGYINRFEQAVQGRDRFVAIILQYLRNVRDGQWIKAMKKHTRSAMRREIIAIVHRFIDNLSMANRMSNYNWLCIYIAQIRSSCLYRR